MSTVHVVLFFHVFLLYCLFNGFRIICITVSLISMTSRFIPLPPCLPLPLPPSPIPDSPFCLYFHSLFIPSSKVHIQTTILLGNSVWIVVFLISLSEPLCNQDEMCLLISWSFLPSGILPLLQSFHYAQYRVHA